MSLLSPIRRVGKRLMLALVKRFKSVEMRCYYCHGSETRLHLGRAVSTMNTIFNVSSGHIYVGDNTVFGHNCMVLTGRHEFFEGQRRKLTTGGPDTPTEGFDIRIGRGCWIASGAIIIGGVTIGDNVIVGAGAVVTKDVPSGVFVAGVPAKIVETF